MLFKMVPKAWLAAQTTVTIESCKTNSWKLE